jgi:hypothetical protein
MAVFAPGDSPPDDGSGAGMDPGMWARLMGYINPIGSANAAPAPAAAPSGRFQGPGTQAQSGGWPVNQAGQPQYATGPINQALASGPGNTNQPAILPHLTGDGPNVQGRPILPYLNPNTRDLSAAAAIPTDGVPSAQNAAPWFHGGNNPLPWNGPTATPPPRPAAAPVVARAPVHPPAAIDPRMRGQVPAAAAAAPQAVNPGWGMIDRPNANPGTGGGMLGANNANQGPRGNGGAPQMGAFNFASLFGGGQPAAAAPAAAAPSTLPRQKIKVKIPASARAEVPPVVTSKAPSDYGPLQQGWHFGFPGGGLTT